MRMPLVVPGKRFIVTTRNHGKRRGSGWNSIEMRIISLLKLEPPPTILRASSFNPRLTTRVYNELLGELPWLGFERKPTNCSKIIPLHPQSDF